MRFFISWKSLPVQIADIPPCESTDLEQEGRGGLLYYFLLTGETDVSLIGQCQRV